MAFQSEVAPPVVGESNKDTLDGDTKSDDGGGDTEDEDLEEGEILDSANEEGAETETVPAHVPNEDSKPVNNVQAVLSPKKKQNSHSSVDVDAAGLHKGKMEKTWGRSGDHNHSKYSNRKRARRAPEPVSDQAESDDDGDSTDDWYQHTPRKPTNSSDGPIDYWKELAEYRGGSVSSPEPHSDGKSDRSSKKRRKSPMSPMSKLALLRMKRKIAVEKKGKFKRVVQPRKICKFFAEGSCSKGGECPYVHISPKKRELCRYYLNGFCSKRRQCTFLHEEFPCKFFHTGAKCYAGENCRFSHEPLTDDTKQLLKECLKSYEEHHGSHKRKRSKSPELPVRRPCILGSPPRHIREAEETKRWQEEMMNLHREKSSDAFQIKINPPVQRPQSPSKFSRNSSVDVAASSPRSTYQKNNPEAMNSPKHSKVQTRTSIKSEKMQDQDFKPPVDWKNLTAMIDMFSDENKHAAIKEEPEDFLPALHNENISKSSNSVSDGDEASQEASADSFPFNSAVSHNDISESETNDSRSASQFSSFAQQESEGASPARSRSPSASRSPLHVQEVVEPDPIVIPSHLPRKQRELLLRIQNNQRIKSAAALGSGLENPDERDKLEILSCPEQKPEKMEDEECEATEKETLSSSSSDDDDDDADKPLTDVLKKLQETPPPKPKEIPRPAPKINISQMLSSIMEKTGGNCQSNSAYQEQNKFWQNILSGTVPSATSISSAPSAPFPPENNVPNKESNRRVLLPDPQVKPAEKQTSEIRDPRLKNRDPRTAASKALAPATNSIPNNIPPIMPLETICTSMLTNHHRDLSYLVPNQTSAVVVEGMTANVPYKLHGVSTKPLNYMPYIQASHSDPKLLNDPRLRKRMSQGTVTPLPSQPGSEKCAEEIPNPLAKIGTLQDLPLFSQMKLQRNETFSLPPLQDGASANFVPHPVIERPTLPDIKLPLQPPKVSDPRTRRAEQRNSTSNNTPTSLLPLETPCVNPIPPVAPTPASHLPRAISDPRMAQLHRRTLDRDDRRGRTAPETSVKSPSVKAKNWSQPESKVSESPVPQTEQPQVAKADEKPDENNRSNKRKMSDTESSKSKAVHRNRKSSMDYASPLNSCDDANSSSALGYNSYNQRPKKQLPALLVEGNLPKENLPSASSVHDALLPEFSASDSSNIDSDVGDANASLKDMFKTKDPTASPFC